MENLPSTETQSTDVKQSKPMAKWQRGLLLSVFSALSLAASLLLPVLAYVVLKLQGTVAIVVIIAVFLGVFLGSRAIMFRLAMNWGMTAEEWYATRGWRFMFSRARRNAKKSNQFWGRVNSVVSPMRTCKACGGKGTKGAYSCPVCGGSGKVLGM